MIKILFLIHDLEQGGAEKVLVNLVNNMDTTQFDITVMTLFDVGVNKQFLSDKIHYRTVFSRVFPGNSHIMKFFSPEFLHEHIIKEHYDIEISYLEGTCARIISGCPHPDTKKVCWIHIEQHTSESASYSFRSIKEAETCYNRFNRIICVSQTVKSDFTSVLNIQIPIDVLYNTNESEKVRKLALEPITECEFKSDEIKLIGVGKLLTSKGFDRILKITKQLVLNGYPVHLYILGIGPEESNLLRYIQDNGLTGKAELLGYQINPYKFVSASDLFVCASHAEGFSTAATEALIVGTPVCTVEVSGMKEMLGENNEYGVVVDNDDKALYRGIKGLVSDKDSLEYYRKQAFLRGRYFDVKNTVSAVEKMLTNL